MAVLLNHIARHLINAGQVRDPRVTGPLPTIWRTPDGGAVGPGDKKDEFKHDSLVASLFLTGGLPMRRYDQVRRRDIVDIWIRALKFEDADNLYTEFRRLLVPLPDQTNWRLGDPGGITVIESLEWRPFQLLQGSSETSPGYTCIHAVLFETYSPA